MDNNSYFNVQYPEHILEDLSQEQMASFEAKANELSEKYPQITQNKFFGLVIIINDILSSAENKDDIYKTGTDQLIELTEIHKYLNNLTQNDEYKIEIVLRSPLGDASKDVHIAKNHDVIDKILDVLREFRNPRKNKRPKGRQRGISPFVKEQNKCIAHLFGEYRTYFRSNAKCYEFICDVLSASGYEISVGNIKKKIQIFPR